MVTVQSIMGNESQINALAKRVNALVSPPLPFGRVVNFDPAAAATFVAPAQTPQQPTWVNGGSDFWLCGLGYQVWWTKYTGTTFTETLKLHDIGTGMGYAPNVSESSLKYSLFDFQWNMTKQEMATGRQISYVAAPGAMNSLLSRTALGNQETNRHLAHRPWKINHGDSVFFTLRPIGYFWSDWTATSYPATPAGNVFTVIVTMFGFRVEREDK